MRRAAFPFLVVLVLVGTLITAVLVDGAGADVPDASRLARPGVYTFYDWQHLDPARYPIVGGHVTLQWKTLDVGPGRYDWGWLDRYLAQDARLGKADGVGLDPYDGPCCGGSGVPPYVAQASPDVEITCGTEVIPRYWHPSYRAAYGRFIADFGRRFDGDPRIAFVEVGVGMFGETQPARDEHDVCLEAAGLTSAEWLDYARWAIDAYAAAFPRTPLVLEYAPRYKYTCERRTLADYAVSRGVGLQHSGLVPDGGGVTVIDDESRAAAGCGQYDPMGAWEGQALLGWEGTEWGDHTGPAATLWRIYNGLDKHPDFILLDAPQVTDPQRRGMIEFANQYAGRTIENTPGVWAALRETDCDWFPQRGNYEFWLHQVHDAPGGRTVPLWRVDSSPQGRYARRTDEAAGNPFMVFDVDNRYLFDVREKPVTVTVTYLDQGSDTWALDYDGRGGAVVSTASVTKTNTFRWLTASFVLADAAFADRLPAGQEHPGSDLRIDSRGDGDETVHFVLVQGDERPVATDPAASPETTATPTPTPAVTPMLTPSLDDLKNPATPNPVPWPPPNSVSAYGSIE